MPFTRILNLGEVGFVSDTQPVALPPNAWSDMNNVRCDDGAIKSFPGTDAFFSPSVIPQTMVGVFQGGVNFIAYAGEGEVYARQGDQELHFTGVALSTNGTWEIIEFGGVGIVNNGVNGPVWGSAPLVLSRLDYDSTQSWDDVGMTAQFLRGFKNFLFAFDINDCDGRNRHRVWWSHPSEGNAIPASWDPTDPTHLAGWVDLRDTGGFLVDAIILRDSLQIFKSDALYSCTYTGSQYRGDQTFLWNFRLVHANIGLFARGCVCDVGGQLFFISDSDFYLYDGTSLNSVADARVKEYFFATVSNAKYELTFVTYHEVKEEVWVFFPGRGDTTCTKALVFNVRDQTWVKRDAPNVLCAVSSKIERGSGYTWETLPYATWEDWGVDPAVPEWTTWEGVITTSVTSESLVVGSADGGGTLYEMDYPFGNSENGSDMTCYAQRICLDLGDKRDWHQIVKIMPHAEGDPFRIRVGSHSTVNSAVVWSDYYTFDPDTDLSITPLIAGRLHAIEFSSVGDVDWTIYGYEVEFVPVGRY